VTNESQGRAIALVWSSKHPRVPWPGNDHLRTREIAASFCWDGQAYIDILPLRIYRDGAGDVFGVFPVDQRGHAFGNTFGRIANMPIVALRNRCVTHGWSLDNGGGGTGEVQSRRHVKLVWVGGIPAQCFHRVWRHIQECFRSV
jgi:hypothetical protein